VAVSRDLSHLPRPIHDAADANIPLSIQWDLTWRCDHSCVHCYLTDRRQAELSLEEAVGVLDQLAEAGTLSILFSGGDPFLRPDAIDIMRAASAREFDLRINTHGNAIDDALADALAQLRVGHVGLSVYSDEAAHHDAITQIPGSLRKTLDAARRLADRDIRVVFKTPLMVHNRTSYHRVRGLAREHGAVWENEAHIVNDDQSDFGLCGIGAHGTERILAMLHGFEHSGATMEGGVADQQLASSDQPACGAASLSGYISPDGRVSPCLHWRDDLGSLRTASFESLWWGNAKIEKQRALRRADYLLDCGGCGFHGHCNYCPGISHAETGDPGRRSEFVCERTHLIMSSMEHVARVRDAGVVVPAPGSPEAEALISGGLPTFAERQWAARRAGMARQADRLPIGLVGIDEPRQ